MELQFYYFQNAPTNVGWKSPKSHTTTLMWIQVFNSLVNERLKALNGLCFVTCITQSWGYVMVDGWVTCGVACCQNEVINSSN